MAVYLQACICQPVNLCETERRPRRKIMSEVRSSQNLAGSNTGGSPNRTYSLDFWIGLKTAEGENSAYIQLNDGFGIESLGETGMKRMQNKMAAGPMYCGAYKLGPAYNLDALPNAAENAVKVFWLPWKDKEITSADRKDFEKSDCQFFMTARLEGCRFVLTKDKVLHVAANVLGAEEGSAGSARRDLAQFQAVGDVPSRRLSISTSNINEEWSGYPYESQAFVFGINFDGIWKYKALIKTSIHDMGKWTTFIDV
jgi:hypothetical protein